MGRKLTIGSCFSGIGGLELGLEWTGGFETRWQIELDPYASAVLAKQWPDVVRYTDIKTVDAQSLGRVDLICGGFPCQDISDAGKRAGITGERSGLWGELLRTIRVVRPRFALVENVAALLRRGMGTVLGDLAESGYDAQWDCIPACSVGAPHQRDRLFIVADTKGIGVGTGLRSDESSWQRRRRLSDGGRSAREVPNSARRGQPMCWTSQGEGRQSLRQDQNGVGNQWAVEPGIRRVAHGVPSRVDRLKCLGNAVVPQVAQRIGEMILDKLKPVEGGGE